jgi:hypothetical protein
MPSGFRSPVSIAALCGLALAGCGSSGDLVVRTVSEYGGTPIAGVKVQVGDQPWMTTGSNGEARVAAVAPPYTVRVYQPMTYTNFRGETKQHDKVWQLIGQTANPLVLDVDGTVALAYKAEITGTVEGRSGAANSQVRVVAHQGGAVRAASDGTFRTGTYWEGSTSYDFVLRAFESDTEEPPAHYTGYAASRVRVTDTTGYLGEGGSLSGVRLQLGPVAEARVSGQVTRAEALAQETLRSSMFLRFAEYDWAWLGPGRASGQPAAFDYTVPRIDGAETWLRFEVWGAAAAPYPVNPLYAWHSRKVALPSTDVSFDIPPPVSLTEPADGATFGPSTTFRWSPGPPGGKYSLGMLCDPEWSEGALKRNIYYRDVETTSTEVMLPAIPGVAIPAGVTCAWSVMWIAPSDPATERRGSWSAGRAVTAQ